MDSLAEKYIYDSLSEHESSTTFSLLGSNNIDEYVNKIINNAEVIFWTEKSEYCGFIAFYANQNSRTQSFITMVFVGTENRGKGIAKALIDLVLSVSQARGFQHCCLSVHINNETAKNIYTKMGFSEVSRDTQYVQMRSVI